MVQVIYVTADGDRQTFDVAEGENVMRAALDNGVQGVEAMCGGACSCATCQVYVDEVWMDRLDPPEELEGMMLGLAEHRRPNSRLSCQIQLNAALDGLTVQVPESQV